MADEQQSTTGQVDPSYVSALRSGITGIFYQDVEGFSDEYIIGEFRHAIRDPALRADDVFMDNQFFLVRKKAINALRSDVIHLVRDGLNTPHVMVAALKTMFALGVDDDRSQIDALLARELNAIGTNAERLLASPFFIAAERIGGPDTLAVLSRLRDALTAMQRQREQTHPDDHETIALLDRARSESEAKVFVLSRKQAITAMPEPEASRELAKLYLLRSGHLGIWAHHLLTSKTPSEASRVDGVRQLLDDNLSTLLPQQPHDSPSLDSQVFETLLVDYRLRGVCLLEALGAHLTPEEQALLAEYHERVTVRVAFFRPQYDWEDLLDRD